MTADQRRGVWILTAAAAILIAATPYKGLVGLTGRDGGQEEEDGGGFDEASSGCLNGYDARVDGLEPARYVDLKPAGHLSEDRATRRPTERGCCRT